MFNVNYNEILLPLFTLKGTSIESSLNYQLSIYGKGLNIKCVVE